MTIVRGENRILKECEDLGGELFYRLTLDLDGYYERKRPPIYHIDLQENDRLQDKERRAWVREHLKRRFSPGMIRRWEVKDGDIDAIMLMLQGKLEALYWVVGDEWGKQKFIEPLIDLLTQDLGASR
jgi:hypothetical protein